MSEELKAIDWLRAKTISYESRSEELHYALILYNLIMNLQKENEELKKQLSNDRQIKMKRLQQENRKLKKQLSNSHQMKNQQKVFMQWLEQNIENEEYCYLAQNPNERCRKDVFEEALSKYKEIIGVKDEKI